MAIPSILLLLLSTITVVVMSTLVPHKPTDTDSLTIFRSRADAHGNLASNWSTQDACSGHWRGVRCSPSGLRVISLSLPALDLRGPLDALTHLDSLRLLDLHSNRINGTLLPLLSSLSNLRFLYLASNDLSGPIPTTIGRLTRLRRLDLSGNDLTGPIPPEISNLTRLLTVRLQDNLLSGNVLDLSALPLLADFNASNNQLEGTAPDGMIAKFGMASLAGNAGLCSRHGSSCSTTSSSQSVVPSNPAGGSNVAAAATNRGPYDDESNKMEEEEEGRLSRGTVIAIITGNSVFLLVVILCFLAAYCCCSHGGKHSGQVDQDEDAFKKVMMVTKAAGGEFRKNSEEEEEESEGGGAEGRSKMVFFASTPATKNMTGRRCEFDLDELLRASAEMVGKGSLGTVYRAVLEDGMTVVAVKRLRDANPCSRKDFHRYMDLIGRLRHPNLVSLRAYYFANQEKLLVYDFLPNGSLHNLLHLHRGAVAAAGNPGRILVDWTMRIRLTLGAARGLAHIHEMYSCIPHGNVRSSNVLLDKKGSACISDFGLALLLSPAQATARLGGYGAPEQQGGGGRLSQEADVYAFGVLLLEVLTGKIPDPPQSMAKNNKAPVNLPEWVRSAVREEWTAEVFDPELMRCYKKNVEEEMVAMLHVGLACVAEQPNQRPTMREVVRMIQDIRTDQSPLPEEEDSDVASSASPSVGATTEEEEEGEGRLSYC